jgi:hypothetical protein
MKFSSNQFVRNLCKKKIKRCVLRGLQLESTWNLWRKNGRFWAQIRHSPSIIGWQRHVCQKWALCIGVICATKIFIIKVISGLLPNARYCFNYSRYYWFWVWLRCYFCVNNMISLVVFFNGPNLILSFFLKKEREWN